MACRYIYKDKNGNPSALYQSALEKYGPEMAAEIYVRDMLSQIDTRFSAPLVKTVAEVLKEGQDWEAAGDSKYYTNKKTGKRVTRVTDYLQSIMRSNSAPVNNNLGIFSKPVEDPLVVGLNKQAIKMINRKAGLDPEKLSPEEYAAKYKKYIADNPGLIDAVKIDIQSRWDAQNVMGTEFHKVLELVLSRWETLHMEQPEVDGFRPQLDPNSLYSEVNAIIKDFPTKFNSNDVTMVARSVIDEVQARERAMSNSKGIQHIHILPEFKVMSTALNPDKASDGLGGTIDVFLASQDGSYYGSIDFKTKENGTDYDRPTGTYIAGPFAEQTDIQNTALKRAKAQQRLYGATLLDQAGIKIKDTTTIIVPMTFYEEDSKAPDGSKKYTASKIAKPVIMPKETVGSSVSEIIIHMKEGDIKEYYQKARETGISNTVETWSGTQEDGQPNATFAKDHKAPYIANKMRQVWTDPAGKKVISILGQKVIVEGKTDEQIKELLSAKYDEAKIANQSIAKDVIEYFNNPTKQLPKSLLGREHAVEEALKGFNRTIHTLHRAQAYGGIKGLEGIGPDVIVAVNNFTGAISLISLVTTDNTRVRFKSDGSKDARTSLLGNYVSNKVAVTQGLDPQLLEEPLAHDFLAMKLGLAALYIRRAQGDTISIDKMKVVSATLGSSVSSTETTLDEELFKLKKMAQVAGTDFSEEHRGLLTDLTKQRYVPPVANHLLNLVKQIENRVDPLHEIYYRDKNDQLIKTYKAYEAGNFVASELRRDLGNYLQRVYYKLRASHTESEVLTHPEFVTASKALLEFEKFENVITDTAAERINIKYARGAVSSGDKFLQRVHVLNDEASGNIRNDMNKFTKEHNKVLDALAKDRGATILSDAKTLFGRMWRTSKDPAQRMMFKEEGSVEFNSLSKAEQDYITFFNDNVVKALIKVSPAKFAQEIANGTFWKRGTVPVIRSAPELITMENLTSWEKLKTTVKKKIAAMSKSVGKTPLIEFRYATQFDSQATDSGDGNSRLRRSRLGIDKGTDPDPDIEGNVALILNMAMLEAAEKEHRQILLQTVAAVHSVLAAEGDPKKTGMTTEMLSAWTDRTLFYRYADEPNKSFQKVPDVIGAVSSAAMFTWSVQQVGTEFITGTVQVASTTLSNAMEIGMTAALGLQSTARFTPADTAWAIKSTNRWNPQIDQMIYDSGVIQMDPNDLKTIKFKAQNGLSAFKSEAGFALNKICFETAISINFVAQMKHIGVTDAYIEKDGRCVYDETLDPRFFVYDPEAKLGTRAPITDDEKKKFSLWQETRKTLDAENMLDKETRRMLNPLTATQRAEAKLYCTRTFGSFNSDAGVHMEGWAIGRALSKYKKYFYQKMANYYTPTIRDGDLYGGFVTEKDADGEYHTYWKGDDFQGILQTLAYMGKAVKDWRLAAATRELNKYQKENLTKLVSDLIMALIMTLIFLPFFEDKETTIDPVTGKKKTTVGERGKKEWSQKALRSATNATQDLNFFDSLGGMGSNMFPAITVTWGMLSNAFGAIHDVIIPPEDKVEHGKKLIDTMGWGKTMNVFADVFSPDKVTK